MCPAIIQYSLVRLFWYSRISILFLSNISTYPFTTSLSPDNFVSQLTEKIEAIIRQLPHILFQPTSRFPPLDLPNYQYLYYILSFPLLFPKLPTLLFKALPPPEQQIQSLKYIIPELSIFSSVSSKSYSLLCLLLSANIRLYLPSFKTNILYFINLICSTR